MCWNDGYERRKFEARQKKQAEEYRALGMTEEQIKEMYEFDLEQYKSDRRYHMHTQPFTSSDFDDGEDDDSESTLLNKFFDELTLTIDSRSEQSRYWWIYLSSLDIIRRMLRDGIASREVLERLNRRNAESMGCKPVAL